MANVLIVGGGAAGLMAAGAAVRQGHKVTVLEHMDKPGQKILVTGKGRCNVTNDCDQETLMANIPGNGRFLYSALTRFTPQDAMAFFEGLGVPLKVERGNRVFPVSDRSFDISGALERELRRLHVRWVRDRAREITVQDGHVTGVQGEKLCAFDPYLPEEPLPEKDIVMTDDHPYAYNRVIPFSYFNHTGRTQYALGETARREAVLLFNTHTELTEEQTVEYVI